jgi:hypothetical protein
MVKRVTVALAVLALLAVGTAAYAGRSEMPDAQVPRNLPEGNSLDGQEIRIWNATNDEAVADLTEQLIEYKSLAAGAVKDPDEAASYLRAAERVQEYIDAVCALPDTTVC